MFTTKSNIKFNTDITLDKFRLWEIGGDRRGDVIRCLSGSLWITQEGDLRDYVLIPGQDFWVTRPGAVIVQALEQSGFKFSLNELTEKIKPNTQPVQPTQPTRVSQHLR